MFAVVGLDTERIAGLVINCLAVGGGFLVGYWVSWAAIKLLDRQFLAGRTPPTLKRYSQILGGILVAVLVAFLLFGSGGTGSGGTGAGGGPTEQPGEGKGPGEGPIVPKVETPVETPPPITPPDPDAKVEKVTVKVLTGLDVKDAKYYLIEGDPTAKTIDELFAKVKEKHAPPKVIVEIIPKYPSNGGEETIGASKLRRRGLIEKITVKPSE